LQPQKYTVLLVVGRVFRRREFGAFVAAVAKGLGLALAAGAPVVVLAFFDIDGERGFAAISGFDIWGSPVMVGVEPAL
jgi:hypothetical protein